MKRPKGVEKTAVLVLEVEWSGLGKCDPLGARFRRNLDAFWTPVERLLWKSEWSCAKIKYTVELENSSTNLANVCQGLF